MPKTMYKLFNVAPEDADHDLETYKGFAWYFGQWVETPGTKDDLCTDSWLHCYSDPLEAELFNPCQGKYDDNAVLYKVEVEGKEKIARGNVKRGYTRMRVNFGDQVERIRITPEQRIEIAIRAAAAANGIDL